MILIAKLIKIEKKKIQILGRWWFLGCNFKNNNDILFLCLFLFLILSLCYYHFDIHVDNACVNDNGKLWLMGYEHDKLVVWYFCCIDKRWKFQVSFEFKNVNHISNQRRNKYFGNEYRRIFYFYFYQIFSVFVFCLPCIFYTFFWRGCFETVGYFLS